MARKKKSKGTNPVVQSAPSSNGGHLSTSIDDVENGFVVNVSGESGGKESKYFSKRYISPTREGALVICSSHLAGSKKAKAGKKKGGGKKRIALKQS